MLVWLMGAALAADPAVHVTWKGAAAELFVRAPAGEHVAEEAPFDLDLRVGERQLRVGGFGEDLRRGLRLGDVRGRSLEGELSVSLCEDGGTRCRLVDVSVMGRADDAKRGLVTLDVGPRRGSAGFPARIDAEAAFEGAVARARAEGRPVLLDFGAVWCPPCQLMDTELFEASPRPSVVDAFVLAKVDVDDPSAWPLKDRFRVGGYPTVVAVEPDGDELGRMVGYRGLDDMVAWLDAVATGRYARAASDPLPAEAAEFAWIAVREGRLDDARAMLSLALGNPENVAFRLARLHLQPTVEDAAWLAERARGRAIDWVGAAGDLADDPEGRAVVRAAVEADLAGASPLVGAELLYFAARMGPPEEARVLFGAAAALVRGQLSGDPARDKGHYDWLADLTELSGDRDAALAVLEEARAAFPDEPTFHTLLGRMQLRQGQVEEALATAERALETAWGDNRLMAALVKVEALVTLGRNPEARIFVDALLAAERAPAAEVDVRTHRYRDRLRALVDAR